MPVRELPRPRSWEDFEDLTRDLFKVLWQSTMIDKNGRTGQPQHGVDVFGMAPEGGRWFGVQCKKKYDLPVTPRELEDELEKARSFNPRISAFWLATTAPRDAIIQERARELSTEALPVAIFGWQNFCEALGGQPALLRKHFPDLYQDDPSDLRRRYLHHLFGDLDDVPVSQRSGGPQDAVTLSSVYVDLDVRARLRIGDPMAREGGPVELEGEPAELARLVERGRKEAAQRDERQRHAPHVRPCTALEAAAVAPRRVLTGRGGSGKSTFGRYLCLCLAGQELGGRPLELGHLNGAWSGAEPELWPWPHGALLPFFVELRRFVRHETFPAADEVGRARHLVRYLATLGPAGTAGGMEKLVLHGLEHGALVVLDGLDETPSAEAVRERLRQVIRSFADLYPACRLLVTSRPHAYQADREWRLDDAGFVAESLAPFSHPKIERFVTDAYAAFARRNNLEDEDSRRLSRDLLATLSTEKTLEPLAAQPLMLTMITDLHASRGGRLPGARSRLFEESVQLLFDRWNERRHLRSVADIVGIDEEQIRGALELLAYRVHRDGGRTDDHACDVPEGELYRALTDTRRRYGTTREAFIPEQVRDHLNERSGILVAESPSLYRFPHRFFQEYLAACHLENFSAKRAPCLDSDPRLWREVMLFLAGRLAQGDQIWQLIRELVPGPPASRVEADDQGFYRALLAALAIRDNALQKREQRDHQAKLDDVRLWLRRAVELGALEVADRAEAGQVLGVLGDDRPGVGLGEHGLPDIEWIRMPAGDFTMGSERFDAEKPIHHESVSAFRIARYPLTNRQYEPFVEDGGYTERWRHCWTDAGWAWKAERSGPERYSFPFDLPNHPRVGVSWYEAIAYCAWLAEQTGTAIRLPAEAEWERAARGIDGREFPWGPDFDAQLCNTGETGLGHTTAVGLFPGGESPPGRDGIGLLDASGNVWEWCSTTWRKNHESRANDEMKGEAWRVLCGDSWINSLLDTRSAYRSYYDPRFLDKSGGFRLVAPI